MSPSPRLVGKCHPPSFTFPSANINVLLTPPLKPLQTQQRQTSAPTREGASPHLIAAETRGLQGARAQEGRVARTSHGGRVLTSVRLASALLGAAPAVPRPQASPTLCLPTAAVSGAPSSPNAACTAGGRPWGAPPRGPPALGTTRDALGCLFPPPFSSPVSGPLQTHSIITRGHCTR